MIHASYMITLYYAGQFHSYYYVLPRLTSSRHRYHPQHPSRQIVQSMLLSNNPLLHLLLHHPHRKNHAICSSGQQSPPLPLMEKSCNLCYLTISFSSSSTTHSIQIVQSVLPDNNLLLHSGKIVQSVLSNDDPLLRRVARIQSPSDYL